MALLQCQFQKTKKIRNINWRRWERNVLIILDKGSNSWDVRFWQRKINVYGDNDVNDFLSFGAVQSYRYKPTFRRVCIFSSEDGVNTFLRNIDTHQPVHYHQGINSFNSHRKISCVTYCHSTTEKKRWNGEKPLYFHRYSRPYHIRWTMVVTLV
jgi:hypothetical protein